jgi:DNA invertase Pin-like site-specific DNA recombinase
MNVAVYVRVSTVEQKIDGQVDELKRWLEGNGISDEEWFIDHASGATTDRPAFERLQKAVFTGEVRTVIVWRLDRLSRSLRDGVNVLADWCDRDVRVVATSQQIDLSGTVGRMVAALLLGVAEIEREAILERQAAGIAVAMRNGVYAGRQHGTTKANPQRAVELRARGLNDNEIATAMGVSRRSVQRYLKRGSG